ncbi:MAG: Gfo/Idh/MocA family protein [Capsulimonadaceae bacterium]
MARQEIRIGLVGYKFMGKAHSNAYRQVLRFFDDLTVVPVMKAICGRDRAGTEHAAQVFGWETAETDWRRLIDRDDIDLIDISAPGSVHAEVAIAAAQAGKHVFCEKPLGNTAAEARAMLDAVEAASVRHAIFFNYRKLPAVALARKIVADGTLGRIHHWRGTYLQDWLVRPDFPLIWRLRREVAGSGAGGDLNSHLVDLARYLVGEITEVCGLVETFIKQRPEENAPERLGPVTVDDAALALARFDNGAVGTFEASRFALGRKNYNRFEINGSLGSIAFNLERPNELEVYTEDTPPGTHGFRTVSVTAGQDPYSGHYWPAAHNLGYEHSFINLLADALRAIGQGENPSPNFHDGYRSNLVLDAIERSSASRRWEPVSDQ